MNTTLTAERLRELLRYEPETGVFTRRIATGYRGRHRAGEIAGSINDQGYRIICVGTEKYRAHQLAWLYMKRVWPGELDHINGVRDDNRLCNLRKTSSSQNKANSKLRTDSVSGFKCVRWEKRRRHYVARIRANGKQTHLGSFNTPERAFVAYLLAAKKHFGAFARWDVAELSSLDRVVRELEAYLGITEMPSAWASIHKEHEHSVLRNLLAMTLPVPLAPFWR